MQVQLIKKFADPECQYIGYSISEKLNGQRAWWDGGVSRGLLKSTVPWADCEKDGRFKTPQIATGLWSRYNKVIHAPAWFLDLLPKGIALDGELFHKDRQYLFSTIKQLVPDERWHDIVYKVYDIPNFAAPGCPQIYAPYWSIYRSLADILMPHQNLARHDQVQINRPGEAKDMFNLIAGNGGEGVVIRDASAYYYQGRSTSLFRWKALFHGEGEIVGWTPGEGKYVGMVGAWTIKALSGDHKSIVGKVFNMSGMTDAQRRTPPVMQTRIKFKYGSVSNEGTPIEPRLDSNDF